VTKTNAESSRYVQGSRKETATQVTDSVLAAMSNGGQYDLA
jgi:hypothetical protein